MWLLVIALPLLIWLDFYLFRFFYGIIFSNEDDFNESVKYTFTPDMFSLFKGEYMKDKFAEFKFSGFIFFCILTIAVEILTVKAAVSFIANF